MAQKDKPIYIDSERANVTSHEPPSEPEDQTLAIEEKPTLFQRLFRKRKPADPVSVSGSEEREVEERRATKDGPQLFSLVVDHSGSMEQGSKAQEATRVLREVIKYARQINAADQTGTKVYFYTQVILFAERWEDVTQGMKRPPAHFTPDQAFTVRHPDHRLRLGNLTDYQAPLKHVYKTLTGKEGMTNERKRAGMPAPIVLFISDGKPNFPQPVETARRVALQEAERIKSLVLPEVTVFHPSLEAIGHPRTHVRLVTIGLGNDAELDQDLLRQMSTHVTYKKRDLALYLHCPRSEDLFKIGTQIVGTVTTADQSTQSLEDVVDALQQQ